MNSQPKLSSLSIFFPFYNDEGTVEKQITNAYEFGNKLTNDLEVIAIHGGNSKDNTLQKINEMKIKFPNLVVIDKTNNKEGYAVIKHGIYAAKKDWVFYTDGDAQYHLDELKNLVEKQNETGADVINGFKKSRGDGFIRFILGDLYAKFSSFIFELPIRDTDCDFRLMRRSLFNKFELVSTDSSILGELIKKLEIAGAKFEQIPVSHFPREYGKSNYTPFSLFKEKLLGDLKLYIKIKRMTGSTSSLRIAKFGMVGITSIIVQTVFFNLFLISFKVEAALATLLADQFAIITSFILNNFYTFHDRKHTKVIDLGTAFIKFYFIVMISTLIQALIVLVGTKVFGETIVTSNIFFVIGLGATFFINYRVQKHLVWFKR